MLRRLEKRELLSSYWENAERALELGRRPRRLYYLRKDRIKVAEALLSEWRAAEAEKASSRVGGLRPA
jgi:hypothetical protein